MMRIDADFKRKKNILLNTDPIAESVFICRIRVIRIQIDEYLPDCNTTKEPYDTALKAANVV